MVRVATSTVAARLRLRAYGRTYVVGAMAVVMTVANLVLSAQAAQTSYDLARLRSQQSALQSEQGQLRYQEAAQHTPAEQEREARQQGMSHPMPAGYLAAQPLGFSLQAPISPPRPTWSAWQLVVHVVDGVLRVAAPQPEVA